MDVLKRCHKLLEHYVRNIKPYRWSNYILLDWTPIIGFKSFLRNHIALNCFQKKTLFQIKNYHLQHKQNLVS